RIADGSLLTPNEYFALHTSDVADFLCGVFYLCWVPLPIFFGLWLYFSGKTKAYLHFALVFLLVNLLGFAGYYIHPAAPPWYVAKYGFDMIAGTPGDVAGLGGFDRMTGLGIFNALYARNANVFAAMPSLHSAYTFVAFLYSFKARSSIAWKIILGTVTLGIWFTAVYTSHHYLLDVAGGIGVTILGYCLFEYILMRLPGFRRFLRGYSLYISGKDN
ncbi:MAG: phosphatase PAP2 family protein, partial [Muribaculaceae bacterium]|nr:phosphatase PAP2 family protein [Muribaculaceae bacterium]